MPHLKHDLTERSKCINCCSSVKHKENNNNGTCGFANKKRTGQCTSHGCLTCAHLLHFTVTGVNMPEGSVDPIPLCHPCWEIHHSQVKYPTPHYSLFSPTDDNTDDNAASPGQADNLNSQ